jgi:hypothetical protein
VVINYSHRILLTSALNKRTPPQCRRFAGILCK